MREELIALSIAVMAALLINGCVAAKKDTVSFEEIKGKTIIVNKGSWHEECDKLTTGDTLNVAFKSSKPGLYEIHYHQRNVKYDFKDQTLADGFKGSFKVKNDAVYCFMYLNENQESVTLTYDMSIEKK